MKKSYNNIIEKLVQQGSDAKYIAEEMRKRISRFDNIDSNNNEN